ncbi:MAG: hypothetical protein ACXWV5_11665 [Flavitalea sp.]
MSRISLQSGLSSFLVLLQAFAIAQEQTYPVTAASFPKEVIPVEGGRIEITAKFNDLSGAILYNEPFLFMITDGVSTYNLGFRGTSGLVGQVGDSFFVYSNFPEETLDFEIITYEGLFSNNNNEWHVFTLQWDKDGIPGIEDGTRKVAIFIDGVHRSSFWAEPTGSMSFPSLSAGSLNLITQDAEGVVEPMLSLKDLTIYDRENNIILQNSLATADAIENSNIGPNGQFNGGGKAAFPYDDIMLSTVMRAHPVFSSSLPPKPLVLTCESIIQKQHNKANYYHITDLKTSGLFSNVDFSISGSTNRSGYGLDVTGYFYPGTSTVLWKAVDKEGNLKTCQTQVEISQPAANDPGWTYYAPIIKDSGIYEAALIPAGDINGDGFNDLVAYYGDAWINRSVYDRRFGTSRTFTGGPLGLSPIPISTKLEGFFGEGGYLPDFTLNSAGNVNGDVFDDLIGGKNFGHQGYLYQGSISGIPAHYSWIYDDFNQDPDILAFSVLGKNAGDVNGDGYSDVVFTGLPSLATLVFHGSSSGLKSVFDWNFTFPDNENFLLYGMRLGDINKDGYDELAFLFTDNSFALFTGSSSGLNNIPMWIQKFSNGYQKQFAAGGDINGDHFNDILVSGYSALDSASYILYGTALGLDTVGVRIPYLSNPEFVGDINGDGFDEVVGNGLIYYGTAKGFYPIPDALVQHLTEQVGEAGDVNNDGFGDILGRTVEEMQLYYGFAGSKPYEERIDLCGTKNRIYSLPELYVNLQGATVKYKITGTTKRSGSGKDASGIFKNGTSYLKWMVTDQYGKLYSFTTTVIVNPYLDVQIVDDFAVKPAGEPNTIYLSYGKQSLTLKSKVTGGLHKYSYKWSTGSTASAITVSPASAGTYWYVLWVTDAKNCKSADSVKVTVIDVRCNQKVTSVLDKYLPGWSNWKILQDFIRDRNFIKVCIPLKGKWISTCVPFKNVASLLAKGAKLGVCQPDNQMIVQSGIAKDLKVEEIFTIKVSPNPSAVDFNLEVNGNVNEPLNIVIRDPLGSTVEMIHCAYSSRLVIGAKLRKGMYFVEVMQGRQRRVVNIIKL